MLNTLCKYKYPKTISQMKMVGDPKYNEYPRHELCQNGIPKREASSKCKSLIGKISSHGTSLSTAEYFDFGTGTFPFGSSYFYKLNGVYKSISRKRTYAAPGQVLPRFKNFDDLEFDDIYRVWSIVVKVDVKFHADARREKQHFILMGITTS
uniref:Uncharacterized protein n=1 Tax=Oryza brachyantha TaxID=4533 RepID=J3LBQ1_ORYBR